MVAASFKQAVEASTPYNIEHRIGLDRVLSSGKTAEAKPRLLRRGLCSDRTGSAGFLASPFGPPATSRVAFMFVRAICTRGAYAIVTDTRFAGS